MRVLGAEAIIESELRVSRDEGHEPAPRAPSRYLYADSPAVLLRQPALDQLPLGKIDREADPIRQERLGGVVLGQHRLVEDLRGFLDPLEEELATRLHLPLAHLEQLQGDLVPLPVAGEEVDVLEPHGGDSLPFRHPSDAGDQVPVVGGQLELLLLGRLGHLALQLLRQLRSLSFEEQPCLGDGLGVFRRIRVAGAGGEALPQVVVEAGALLAVELRVANRHAEELRNHSQRPPGERGRQEGTEVEVPVRLRPADQSDAGVLVFDRQLQVGIVLVVAEDDVVAGALPFDEVVLQHQRLDLGVGQDQVEIPHLLDHPLRLRRMVCSRLEVGTDPALEGLGLADVDDPPLGVLVDVDTGVVGQLGEAAC